MDIKGHLKRNQELYVGIALGAGFTCLIVRTHSYRTSTRLARPFCPTGQVIAGSPFAALNSYNTTNNFNAKRLSYIVTQTGTDKWWESQAQAARDLGLTPGSISDHINHGSPLPDGISLTRKGVAS